MSPITSHVLDTAVGKPASGIVAVVEIEQSADRWAELARGVTDDDGRIAQFTPALKPLKAGVYRLRFLSDPYYTAAGLKTFYPEVDVIVRIEGPAQHYHIPLLLSPFGYTTYRGS